MCRTIFRQFKVLINRKFSYIVSLCHLYKLSLCLIGTPINIRSVIKWWLRFDVIDGSWFFSAWNLYYICHTTNSFHRRIMHDEDVSPPNEKSHAYHLALLTTDVIFASWPLQQFLLSPNAYLMLGLHYVPGSHGSHGSQKRSSPWCF